MGGHTLSPHYHKGFHLNGHETLEGTGCRGKLASREMRLKLLQYQEICDNVPLISHLSGVFLTAQRVRCHHFFN